MYVCLFAAPPLSVDRVTKALSELADHWDDIAFDLGVPDTTQESIASEHRTTSDRLEAMVRWYLCKCPFASWRYVITALNSMCGDEDYEDYHDDLKRVLSRISSFAEVAGQSAPPCTVNTRSQSLIFVPLTRLS